MAMSCITHHPLKHTSQVCLHMASMPANTFGVDWATWAAAPPLLLTPQLCRKTWPIHTTWPLLSLLPLAPTFWLMGRTSYLAGRPQ